MTKSFKVGKNWENLMKKIEEESKKRVTTNRQMLSDIAA